MNVTRLHKSLKSESYFEMTGMPLSSSEQNITHKLRGLALSWEHAPL